MEKILFLLLTLISSIALTPVATSTFAQPETGVYPDEIIFIHYLDEQVAVKEVQAGNLHTYFWRIPLELADELKKDPNLRVYESPGGTLSLLLNPAPTVNGFNPFSLREVRYAVNYVVSREYVVNEVLMGYGAPQLAVYGLYDPDYLVVAEEVEALGFKYNPELANKLITEALTSAGAEKVGDRWTYGGKPIKVNFFIRSDDPKRKSLGEALSSDLDKLGFTVEKVFGDLTKAYDVVYGRDPKLGDWHIYTEGWGRSAFVKYDTIVVAQMYAPWYGYMPGFGEAGYWNYQQKELDEITQRIATGNYTSKDERDELVRRAVVRGVDEAVRIYVASVIEPYAVNKAMQGVVNDFGAGITGRWTLMNARLGETAGGSLKIGMKQIYQGSWNPVAGFADLYSRAVWLGISDPALWTHPHTGSFIPVRASWTVEVVGPEEKLPVPADAFLWDPVKEEWREVGLGVNATSKVTFDFTYSKWHHGVPMGKADIIYGLYFLSEWGTHEGPDDQTFDPEFTSRAEPFVKTLKGVRFLGEDKVEVYVDYWHFDKGFIADYASVWASTPWEIDAAMEKVVLDKKAAYSRSASGAQNVEWLSLIIKSNADMVKEALMEFEEKGVIPRPLQGYVSADEAAERYRASINWINQHDHAVISNGPYYLVGYNPEARVIKIRASRDPTYPIALGKWKAFETVMLAEVKEVEVPTVVEIGAPAAINISLEVGGKASNDAVVSYMITDLEGGVVMRGEAEPSTPTGAFKVNLSGDDTVKLKAGSCSLKVFAVSSDAMKPVVYETSFIASEAKARTPTPVTSPTPKETAAPPSPPAGIGVEVLAAITVSAVVAVVALSFLIIKKRKSILR